MTARQNPFAAFASLAEKWDLANAERNAGAAKRAPIDERASVLTANGWTRPLSPTAALILRMGAERRAEQYEEGESDGQKRGPRPKPAPGQIVLDAVEAVRKQREREGR